MPLTTILLVLVSLLSGLAMLGVRLHRRHTDDRTLVVEAVIAVASMLLLVSALTSESSTGFVVRAIIFFFFALASLFLIRSLVGQYRATQRIEELNTEIKDKNEALRESADTLKQTNEYLKDLIKTKTEFLQIASHQIRTPLTGLRGMLSMLIDGQFDNVSKAKQKEVYKQMYHVANSMHRIVSDLLNTMRLEEGKIQFNFKPVNIDEVLTEVQEVLTSAYAEKKIELIYTKPEASLPLVRADQEYIGQVFLNLLDNALKYTEKGSVTISPTYNPKKRELTVSIKDTGVGIDPQELDKISQKFVRGEQTRSKTEGSGLGLYIVQKIVAAHHGHMHVVSEGMGKGTTIEVVLPAETKNK